MQAPINAVPARQLFRNNNKYPFIVIEGSDGTGKSTIMNHILKHLSDLDIPVEATKEPGSPRSAICTDIREMLFSKPYSKEMGPVSQGLLFFIDHYENARYIESIINERVIVCDRYYFSQYVYDQVKGSSQVDANNLYTTYEERLINPDLVLHLDLDAEVACTRANERKGKEVKQSDKAWGGSVEIAEKTRIAYNKLGEIYRTNGMNWITIPIDKQDSPEEIYNNQISPYIDDLLAMFNI